MTKVWCGVVWCGGGRVCVCGSDEKPFAGHMSVVALQDSPNKSGGQLACLPLNVHFALRSCALADPLPPSSLLFKRTFH